MNLFSAAERLAAVDRSNVVYNPARCLHTLNRAVVCDACVQSCPVGALTPGKPPVFDEKACVNCLACLPACPTGAFTADDETQALLTCAARLEGKAVELVCGKQPPGYVYSTHEPGAALLRLRGCLAGLGASSYLALTALGVQSIVIHGESCAACPWRELVPVIERQIQETTRYLSGWGGECALRWITRPEQAGIPAESVWDVHNPPLSRRDLFRMASRQGQVALARAIAVERPASGSHPSKERIRLSAAIKNIPPHTTGQSPAMSGMGYAWVTVSDSCTACGVCARACPTSALVFAATGGEAFTLEFHPPACIGCGICVSVCAQGSVSLEREPTFQQVFHIPEAVMLAAGELVNCKRCRRPIAKKEQVEYCPLCEFRLQNPFGSSLPPGFAPPEAEQAP